MSHNTDSIVSISKMRLGLDRSDFQLDCDTIKVYTFNEPSQNLHCLNLKDFTCITQIKISQLDCDTIKVYTLNEP